MSCEHCRQVTAIYDTDVILKDGIKVFHVPDTVKAVALEALEAKHDFPADVRFTQGWSPHWFFQGEVEAFLSGRRYAIGVGGDRVCRVTHTDTRQVSGRLATAAFHFPREKLHFEPWSLARCRKGAPPAQELLYALHVDQEWAITSFENLMKEELLKERAFQTEQCDRFEILCRNFRQALVYVPVRVWHVPNTHQESERKWVVHYGHTGRTVSSTSTLEELLKKGQKYVREQDLQAYDELRRRVL